MLKEGMFLGDRYEILEMIGVGGMAEVYKAKCHKLNRMVAIKVLKKEFCDDENFVARFKAEAQAAAGLSHPNVVSIFDVGDEGELHYIVMELVEGITLKEYIQKKGKLEIREAIGITIQIVQGIGAAHERHIVHRDIKPQNVIISKEGKVKVTDFGIAKAASSNTINSDAVGSVYYFSPEQARGGYSDERSDIYSLGISLYEMLTGKVPFDGDSTVSIALAHLNNEMIPPRQLDPLIPISLEKIILKATQKKPERRYNSVTELITDLRKALLMPDEDFVTIPGQAEDETGPTVIMSDSDLMQIKQMKNTSIVINDNEADETPEKPVTGSLKGGEVISIPEDDDEDDEDEGGAIFDKLILVLGIILCVLILCVAFYFLAKTMNWIGKKDTPTVETTSTPRTSAAATTSAETTMADSQVRMPNVVGMKADEADKLLKSKNLGYQHSKEEYSEIYEKGVVIAQDYAADTIVDKHSTVHLTISKGSSMVVVPENLIGEDEVDVIKTLKSLGLVVSPVYEASEKYKKGQVIQTSPSSGGKLKAGDRITVYISQGEEIIEFYCPTLIGKNIDDLDEFLTQNQMVLGDVTEEFNEYYDEGLVIKQSIDVNEKITAGTKIDVTISKGSQYVEMPDLTGKTRDEAEKILVELKLKLRGATYENSDEVEKGKIMKQSVKEGRKVKFDTEIEVVISDGVRKVTLPSQFRGRKLDDVKKELEDLELEVEVIEEESKDVTEGYVLRANYEAGIEVPYTSTITLVVAKAPPTTPAPTTPAPTTPAPTTPAPTTPTPTTPAPTTPAPTTPAPTTPAPSTEEQTEAPTKPAEKTPETAEASKEN
ncbi:MAG: Stk1 family PASTA domain-containing Ser/Thr kinase [Lachnospiraceae bacterium]|nr:Stk1 family PASTA domain-containing Ser/Thr kinase [Lachnospiraceae bacterium]